MQTPPPRPPYPQPPTSLKARPKGWWGRNWKWVAPLGCLGVLGVVGVVLAVGGYFAYRGFSSALADSEVVRAAVARANSDRRVGDVLGAPVKVDGLVQGSFKTENGGGVADLQIPVSGPLGSGKLFAAGTREGGAWSFTTLELEVEGRPGRMTLLAPGSAGEYSAADRHGGPAPEGPPPGDYSSGAPTGNVPSAKEVPGSKSDDEDLEYDDDDNTSEKDVTQSTVRPRVTVVSPEAEEAAPRSDSPRGTVGTNNNSGEPPRSAPPPPAKPSSPVMISGGVLNGKALSMPQPAYPPVARAARASGAVTVQVTLNESGQVVSASAVSGHPLLQQAAVQAARQARFSPTLLSGQPVKVRGVIVYNFRLE